MGSCSCERIGRRQGGRSRKGHFTGSGEGNRVGIVVRGYDFLERTWAVTGGCGIGCDGLGQRWVMVLYSAGQFALPPPLFHFYYVSLLSFPLYFSFSISLDTGTNIYSRIDIVFWKWEREVSSTFTCISWGHQRGLAPVKVSPGCFSV